MLNFQTIKVNKLQFGIIPGFIAGLIIYSLITAVTPLNATTPKMTYLEIPVKANKENEIPINLTSNDQLQIQCLAENTYFEAGNQSRLGMIAVNNVVINRVNDGRFADTPCKVINQRRSGVCQFSWKCEGRKRIRNYIVYEKARELAEGVYLGNIKDVTYGAQFYHAIYVRPSWSRIFDRTIKIGDHIFYRG